MDWKRFSKMHPANVKKMELIRQSIYAALAVLSCTIFSGPFRRVHLDTRWPRVPQNRFAACKNRQTGHKLYMYRYKYNFMYDVTLASLAGLVRVGFICAAELDCYIKILAPFLEIPLISLQVHFNKSSCFFFRFVVL